MLLALLRSGDPVLEKRGYRVRDCCCWPKAWVGDDGSFGLALGRCRDRLCPLCASCRSREAAAKIGEIALSMPSPRFLTLTLRSSADPLGGQLDRLFKAFRDLRRSVEWKRHVRGGVATLELTRNPATGHWHPHLHVLVDGHFFPQPVLKKAWLAVTGDSFIVDVRAVHDRHQAAKYVAKYVGKPANFEPWPERALCEYAAALHGRRTILTFGSCHNSNPAPRDTGDRPKATRILSNLMHVARMADAGHPRAQTLRSALARLGHSWCTVLGVQALLPGQEPDPPTPALLAELESMDRIAGDWAQSGQPDWEPPPRPKRPDRQRALWRPPHG